MLTKQHSIHIGLTSQRWCVIFVARINQAAFATHTEYMMKSLPEASQEYEQLTGQSSTNILMAIRHTGVKAAARLLKDQAPGLSDDATEAMLQLAQRTAVEFNKSKFYAVAWCMGASYGQLAAMFGVTRATVVSTSRHYLTADVRESSKTARSKFASNITNSQLATIKTVYEELLVEDGLVMQQMKPQTVAMKVLDRMKQKDSQYNDSMDEVDPLYG